MLGNRAIILKAVNKMKELSMELAFSLLTVPPGKGLVHKETFTFTEVSQLINEERRVDFEYQNFEYRCIVSY